MSQEKHTAHSLAKSSPPSFPVGRLSEELGSQLESYRELLDGAQAIVWRANAQTFQFTFVSRFAETLLGYPLQHWSKPGFWAEHIHPDDRDWAVSLCANATKEAKTHELDYRMIAADGRSIWVHDMVRVVVENNRPSELVGVMVDITDKKNAELALQRSEDYLRQVIDTIPQEIWSGTPDGTIDYCNLRWRSELGMNLEDLRDDGWRQMIHPDDQDRVWEAWSKSVTKGIPYEQQERHRLANGQYRWFLSRGIPLRDAEDKIVRWFGSNTDINDQKEAEEALRASEQRWRGAFENSSVGVALQDASFRYLDANPAFCRMVGYSCDELRNVSCLDITYPDDRETYREVISELINGQRTHFEFEKRYIRKNGELIWARENGSLIFRKAEDGKSPLWVVMNEDISDRKRLSDELKQERDRLRLLLDLNYRIASKLDAQNFFNALVGGVQELAGWDWISTLLPDATSTQLSVYSSSKGSYLREGDTLPIDGSLEGEVYRTGKAVSFRIEELPALCSVYRHNQWMQEIARDANIRAGCALPLIHEGVVIGVGFLMTSVARESISRDLEFLQELAKVVAAALYNTLRFQRVNQLHEKLLVEREYSKADFLRESGFTEIIGNSPAILDVLRQISAVAPTDSTVLVTGETGTGKELVARAIHDRSSRRGQSLIKVDCAAIPAGLMESELFGHEKGAFTGATAQKLGRFEIADHGTLFLDEVGDIPLELQPKLLRVLQDHAFERLGSTRTRAVDVRIVAATRRDLEAMVEEGTFREDLYYRLKVFPIIVPPLRERQSDIPSLIKHYVWVYAKRMKKEVPSIPASTMVAFVRYPWPGNVRELQHFIERSVIISSGRILQAPLSELERITTKRRQRNTPAITRLSLEQVERESILQALRESNWVVGGPHGAAAKLGLRRTTLASRMERLGISRPA